MTLGPRIQIGTFRNIMPVMRLVTEFAVGCKYFFAQLTIVGHFLDHIIRQFFQTFEYIIRQASEVDIMLTDQFM